MTSTSVKSKKSDKVFAKQMKISDFKFDKKVAEVFDDMLSRSVPLYSEAQSMAVQLALNFVQKKSAVYDIGCSTGNVLKMLSSLIHDDSVKLIGLDNSPEMIKEAHKKLKSLHDNRIELVESDICENFSIDNASVIIMNYILQFVRPLYRETLIRKLYKGLNENGCLILVEKVLEKESLFNRLYIDLYYQYKRRRGYSDKEIAQKREALENILVPYKMGENIELLKSCGFSKVNLFFKWFNFAGIIAVKE